MDQASINFAKWWTTQKPLDKLFVLLIIALIGSVTLNLRQAGSASALQEIKETTRIECEQRLERRLTEQRNFSDSILSIVKQKYEDQILSIYTTRTPVLNEGTKKIENSLNKK